MKKDTSTYRDEPISTEVHIVDELESALSLSRSNVPKELLATPSLQKLFQYTLIDWAILIVAWIGMWFSPIWLYPIWLLIACSRYHAFGVILHDLTHKPLRKKTGSIRCLEILNGYPIGTTLNAMRYHHLRHHKDSGMHTDPYFKEGLQRNPILYLLFTIRGVLLPHFWTLRGFYGSLAYYFPNLRNGYARVFLQDRSGKDLQHSKEVDQCAKEERWQALCYLLLFSFCWFYPKLFLFGHILPVSLAGLLAGYRLMMEHEYEAVKDRKLETIIHTTRDHHLTGALKFFMAPRNIGYHIVHHLHPQVAWYHLPKLRKWYMQKYPNLYPPTPAKSWTVLQLIFKSRRA